MKKPERKSGGKKLVEAGRKPVLIGLTPEQYETIRRAANEELRPITQFLTFHGLAAAEKILENSDNSA